MAIDKSKENTRIAELLAMSVDDLALLCAKRIDNPKILQQFLVYNFFSVLTTNTVFEWKYAVAAGLIDWDDVKWIEEHVDAEEEEEEGDDDTNENDATK